MFDNRDAIEERPDVATLGVGSVVVLRVDDLTALITRLSVRRDAQQARCVELFLAEFPLARDPHTETPRLVLRIHGVVNQGAMSQV